MNQLFKSLVLILLLSPKVVHAQTNKIDVGLELGVNSFQIVQFDPKRYDLILPEYGYGGGLQFRWNFSKHFSVQSGISYEHKLYSWEDSNYPMTGSFNYISNATGSQDYLTIPVLARFNLGKKVNFFCNIGGYVGSLIKQQEVQEHKTYSLFQIPASLYEYQKTYVKNTALKFDYGLAAGIGIGVPIKKHWYISLEFRDYLGLAYVRNTYRALMNTNNLLLGVSYKLDFREEAK